MLDWYLQPAEQNEIVLSSRIRLARNLTDFPFESKISPEQQKALNRQVKSALENIRLGENALRFLELSKLTEYERAAMIENHCISPDFAKDPENKLLAVSASGDISIMVGEEDHLRIQVLKNGLNLSDALKEADQLDNLLDETLRYAFSDKLGFLTACPTNLGTGLRASVMLHLPAMTAAGSMSRLSVTLQKLGLTIRGLYGEGSKAYGNIYQVSNQITLGMTEREAVDNLKNIVMQIIKQEKSARETVYKDKLRLEDDIGRSLGTLSYACILSSEEAMEHLSNLRLGVSMGILSSVNLQTINALSAAIGSGSVCRKCGRLLPPEQRDAERCRIVKQILKQPNKE